jgi:uncharacterized protein
MNWLIPKNSAPKALLFLAALASLSVLAFGAKSPQPTAKATQKPAPKVLTIATNPPGATAYDASVILAKRITDNTDITVRVQAVSGASAALAQAAAQQADMATQDSGAVYLNFIGHEGYESTPNIRWITTIYPGWVGFVVKADSPYQQISDLKGARVASEFTAQRAVYTNSKASLAAAGLTWDDVVQVPVANANDGLQLLLEGRVDASLTAPASSKPQEIALRIAGGIRWLPLPTDADAVARMQRVKAGALPDLVKAGRFPTVKVDTPMLGYFQILAAPAEQNDDVVYTLTKAMWEHSPELAAGGGALRDWTRERMVHEGITVPTHQGAIRFYKEVGVWTDKLQQINDDLLKQQQ